MIPIYLEKLRAETTQENCPTMTQSYEIKGKQENFGHKDLD